MSNAMTKVQAIDAMMAGHSVRTPRCPGATLYMRDERFWIRYGEGTVVEWIQAPPDETPDWVLCEQGEA